MTKRKLSVGETLNETFSLYGQHAGVLLPIAFWLFLVVAIFEGIAHDSLALAPLAIVVTMIATTLYQGVVVSLVRDVQDGRRDTSMGGLVSQAMPFLWPLIGAGILSGIGIGIGFILLIVPGLILLTIWAVIAPAIVVENRGVFAAFGRSRELVRGNGWPVFGAIVVAFLIVFVAALIFTAIAVAIADGILLLIVFSALASTLTAPVMALVAAVLYYRLVAIEGPAPVAEGVPPAAPDQYGTPPTDPGPPPPPPAPSA